MREAAEPVQWFLAEYGAGQQTGGSAVQAILAIRVMPVALGVLQWTMPRVPVFAILFFNYKVRHQLADIVQQGGIIRLGM